MNNNYNIIFKSICCFFINAVIIISGCGKEVSRTPVEPEPEGGVLVVNSNPANAYIFLNGRNTGRLTPDTIIFLDYDIYELTLKKKYFRDTTLYVEIKENEESEVAVNYYTNPLMYGQIHLTSVPSGAQILINDSLINKTTPYTFPGLLPGEYDLTFKLFDHKDTRVKAIVKSNETSYYTGVLRDTSVWVDYQVSNSDIASNNLSAIAIDQSGIKWIGSLDKGLIKFDEKTFINYITSNSGIPSNIINCISVSPDNKIWAGTPEGIGVFDGSSWVVYNMHNSGLKSNIINSIEFDVQNNIWIGSSSGLYKFDGFTWEHFNTNVWVLDTQISGDKIWLGTIESGIASFSNGIITYYPMDSLFYPSNKVSGVEMDLNGNIWFCHSSDSSFKSGISYFNGNSFTSFQFGISNTSIYNIEIDKFNNKWISTNEGLLKYNSANASELITSNNSLLSSKRVTSAVVDDNSVLWITTSGGGLNKYKFTEE